MPEKVSRAAAAADCAQNTNGRRKVPTPDPTTPRDAAHTLPSAHRAPQKKPQEEETTMQKTKRGMEGKERMSFGGLMLTIVIANALVLVYALPYA
jgi:hypothetical protein